MKLLVKGVRVWPIKWKELYPRCPVKVVTQQEGIVFRLDGPLGAKRSSCAHPQKARMPTAWSSVGRTTSRSAMQLRNASLPILVNRGGSQMSARATQWAKVELRIAVTSVHIRLTSTRCLQFSHALEPILWKSPGRQRLSRPDPQKLPSGSVLSWLVRPMAKVIVVSVRQLSKA